jgi:hypothetical protein
MKDPDKILIREYKKKNIDRIISGINKINAEENKTYPLPIFIEQGSISMSTTNQSEDKDYDIDVAVIFPKDGFFSNPLHSRQFIAKALNKDSSTFSHPPEARTNAVTVWYTEGYHVDFAIYRSYDKFGSTVYEHASAEFLSRDPRAVTQWFLNEVSRLSPTKARVESNQFRKIVRLLKRFCKSRFNWDLPGGFILSILASSSFSSHNERDDIAFVTTLLNISNRLKNNRTVYNPTNGTIELTSKKRLQHQITRLVEKLDRFESKSKILFENNCSEDDAKNFYKWVFNTKEKDTIFSIEESTRLVSSSSIIADIHRSKTSSVLMSNIPAGKVTIHKKLWIKFTVTSNVTTPFDIKWVVENDGDEAKAIPDLGHETWSYNCSEQENSHWERTAYKGIHKLTAEVYKFGQKQQSHTFMVKIQR